MKALRFINRRGSRVTLAVAAVAATAVVATTGAGAKPAAPAAGQAKVKAVAFFGFSAANSFAQATWAGVQATATPTSKRERVPGRHGTSVQSREGRQRSAHAVSVAVRDSMPAGGRGRPTIRRETRGEP